MMNKSALQITVSVMAVLTAVAELTILAITVKGGK